MDFGPNEHAPVDIYRDSDVVTETTVPSVTSFNTSNISSMLMPPPPSAQVGSSSGEQRFTRNILRELEYHDHYPLGMSDIDTVTTVPDSVMTGMYADDEDDDESAFD